MITTAKEFLDHCRAGLVLGGQDEDGAPEWIGEDRNWRVYEWIADGAYDDLSDKGEGAIHSFLN